MAMMQQIFIGRKDELNQFKRLLDKRTSSIAIIRGRRRVGKSRLVAIFAEGKTFYRFAGLPPNPGVTAQDQRDEFALQLSVQTQLPDIKANDWSKLFLLLAEKVKHGRVIILLDEVTWMANDDPTFLGKLKNVWDMYLSKNPKLILVICGSISAWIEKNIINSTGFIGRISLEIVLNDLPMPDCNQLFNALGFARSAKEKLIYLSLCGCIPWYIEQINPLLCAEDNINQLCFQPDALLVKEFDRVFHDLFGRRGDIYQRIVASLAEGPLSYSAIAKKIKYSTGDSLTEYLNELVSSKYISRFHSWNIKDSKESSIIVYRLSDNYLRFYFKYMLPKINAIQAGRYRNVSLNQLPGWKTMSGLQFENLILNNKQLIWENLHINPADIIIDNPYIQRKSSKAEGCQIDYLIQTRFNTLFACQIKFTMARLTKSLITQTQEKLKKLHIPRAFSIVPVLIYSGELADDISESEYFYKTINIDDLMTNRAND